MELRRDGSGVPPEERLLDPVEVRARISKVSAMIVENEAYLRDTINPACLPDHETPRSISPLHNNDRGGNDE